MTIRIFVDYNTIAAELSSNGDRVSINTRVFKYLLDVLRPSLPVVLYDDESLEVDAIAEFDTEHQSWYGVPDWTTRRDLPALSDVELDRIRQSMSIE